MRIGRQKWQEIQTKIKQQMQEVKGKETEEFLNQDIQVILQISEQTAPLCWVRKMFLALLALYLNILSKAGKTDFDLTGCLKMLLIWHEEKNVASIL